MDERDYKAMNEELNQPSCLGAVNGSYVVFEDSHEHKALMQLSVTLPTIERAREYVKGWKSKKLYIYMLVE
jgi:hypothetical protein